MGFFIFMLIMVLLTPAVTIIFGASFKKSAPKEINYIFGYRTERSMKTRETWDFAHSLLGKIWLVGGLLSVPVSALPMLLVMEKSKDAIGTASIIIIFVQVAALLLSLIPVERALKKNFDKDGKRIEKEE
ncbi:MAG: SdpI family protein [Clostridia bacterium]|nr:SdpI family protein [Clostridia bacterium]